MNSETTLYGLQAIAANNGWEYAFLGISIVFSGLVVLSLAISQLYKLISVWEKRDEYVQKYKDAKKAKKKAKASMPVFKGDIQESVRQFKLLAEGIGETFPLAKLLSRAEKSGLFRPHATLNELILAGFIVPDGTGYYTWKK